MGLIGIGAPTTWFVAVSIEITVPESKLPTHAVLPSGVIAIENGPASLPVGTVATTRFEVPSITETVSDS